MAWNEPGPGRDPWNTPSGGNRGGDKPPPDLNTLLRRLRSWLGGGGGMPGANSQNGLAIIAVAILLFWLGTGVYSVDEQERAVVLRFGAYAGTSDTGLHWHLPWPIERVERVPVTRARSVTSRATVLTKDENLVDVELIVQYRVSLAEEYLFGVADPDDSLRRLTAATLLEVVGARNMDAVLHDGRDSLADTVKHHLQTQLDHDKSGLLINEVTVQDVKLPDAIKAAFDDVSKAREDQQRLENDAQAYADNTLPHARAEAARELAEAQAYKARTIARAQGDAARFSTLLGEYRQAPDITRERLYIDAMKSVLSQTGKVMVDVDKGSPVINVPLEQLLKPGARTTSPAPDESIEPGVAAPAPHGTPPPAGSNNDSLRSRDRESH